MIPPHNINDNLKSKDSQLGSRLSAQGPDQHHYGQPHENILPGAARNMSESVNTSYLRRYLETSAGRKHLADRLKIVDYNSSNKEKLDHQINLILGKVEKYGTIIDENEKRSLASRLHDWHDRTEQLEIRSHELDDKVVTYHEKLEREHREGRKDFLEEYLKLKP